jgi:hypothetical protein
MTGFIQRSIATRLDFPNHRQSHRPAFRLTNYNLSFAELSSLECLSEDQK